MILSTTPTIEGCTILEYRCMVFGEVMSGVNFIRHFKTGIRNIVGGLYGVHRNGIFAGESMCSLEPGTSKLALVSLARRMEADGEKLIDCQFHTDHLESMGGRTIPYDEYMRIIQGAE